MPPKTVGEFWRDYFLEVRNWGTVPTQVKAETAQEFATWLAFQEDFRPDRTRQA